MANIVIKTDKNGKILPIKIPKPAISNCPKCHKPHGVAKTGKETSICTCYVNGRCSECDLYEPRTVERTGLCTKCLDNKSELIKAGDHYVPQSYRFTNDTGELEQPKYHEDVNARLPSVEWCPERKKFKLTFDSADLGGYDVTELVWYFDTTEDILKAMGLNKEEIPSASDKK